MSLPLNYRNAPKFGPEGSEHVLIYNNTVAALTNGDVMLLASLVTATDTDNPIIVNVPLPAATSANESNRVIVIDDPSGTIAVSAFGLALVRGFVKALVDGTPTDVAVGDQLEIIDSGTAFIVAGAASSGASGLLLPECSAIAMEAYTTNSAALKMVCLLGKQADVAAS
jgi:hypothetical protein